MQELRKQLKQLKKEINKKSSKKKTVKCTIKTSSTAENDDEVQEVEFVGGRGLSSSEVSRKNGEEHLLKWITLLSEDGNTPEHNIARVIAMQCQELASHPTFRPMFSDVSPTFICSDKRDSKRPKFYNPCENDGTRKRKPSTIKKEKEKKPKHDKSRKLEKDKKSARTKMVSVPTFVYHYHSNVSHALFLFFDI